MPNFTKNNAQKKLNNYIEIKNFLSNNEIKKIFDIIKELNLELISGKIGNDEYESTIRENKILWIPFNDKSKWIYDIIINKTFKINNENFQFQIDGYPEIQISYYYGNNSGHYSWHTDIGEWPLSKRKVSIIIQLSDPLTYEGGKLHIFDGGVKKTLKQNKGDGIIFPSYIPHKVDKVIKGNRISLVLWLNGNPFI